jgi:signal transduction histidine kinase
MGKRFKRTKYFVHPSTQLKCMCLSILPALIVTLFCIHLLINSAGLVLNVEKVVIFATLFVVLACTAMLSLLYSHRIAGPVLRVRRYIDMLSEDIDMLPIRVRRYDEFRELARSLEKLRGNLKNRGLLESEQSFQEIY